jgi:hypothetical protein
MSAAHKLLAPMDDRAYLTCHNIIWLIPFPFDKNLVERLFFSIDPGQDRIIIEQLKEDLGE